MLIIQHRTQEKLEILQSPSEDADCHEFDVQLSGGLLYFSHDQLDLERNDAVEWGAPNDFPSSIILDFKESSWAQIDRLGDELAHLCSHREVRVSSQSLHFLKTIKSHMANRRGAGVASLKVGWVFEYGPLEWDWLKEIEPEFISVHSDMIEDQYVNIRSFDPELKIFVYPVDGFRELKEMEALGVDGVFTKNP